jgi:hypothetical protein
VQYSGRSFQHFLKKKIDRGLRLSWRGVFFRVPLETIAGESPLSDESVRTPSDKRCEFCSRLRFFLSRFSLTEPRMKAVAFEMPAVHIRTRRFSMESSDFVRAPASQVIDLERMP